MPPIVLVLAAALAAAQSQPSFDDLIKRFNERHDALDLQGALAACEQAHAQDPGRVAGLTCLAHVHNDLGVSGPRDQAEPHYRKAIEYAKQAQSQHPDNAVGHFWAAASAGNLALLKGGKEKVRLAQDLEKDARRAIDLDPNFSPPYVALGIYYRELAELSWVLRQFAKLLVGTIPPGSLEDSRTMLEKGVQLSPGIILGHYELGRTYESLGRKEDALREYQSVAALPIREPRDPNDKARAAYQAQRLAR